MNLMSLTDRRIGESNTVSVVIDEPAEVVNGDGRGVPRFSMVA